MYLYVPSNMEEWRLIDGFPKYSISNFGKVKNNNSGQILKDAMHHKGYPKTSLFIKGRLKKGFFIHRLVALHFIPNPDNLDQVNHIDGNKVNNHVSNLQWCTGSQNIKHAFNTGLMSNMGTQHPRARLTEKQVLEIRAKISNGVKPRFIAREYGISPEYTKDIKDKKAWKHI